MGGFFIDEILEKLNVGYLCEVVDGAYKVKTSFENLPTLKEAIADVADVEEQSVANAVRARTFAEQRSMEERVARDEELPLREQLLAMRLLLFGSGNFCPNPLGHTLREPTRDVKR